MAYDVSLLPDYVEQNKTELISKALFDGVSMKLFLSAGQVQTGVKKDTALNIVEFEIKNQDGSTCGWNSLGNSSFSQRTISAYPIKVNQDFCVRDLEKKFTQVSLPKGSKYENLPFEQFFADGLTKANAAEVEAIIWRGERETVPTPGNNLEFADGFLTILAGASHIDASGLTFNATNAVDIVNTVYGLIPAQLLTKDDLYIFLSPEYYRIWTLALTKANLFHYTVDAGAGVQELRIPGGNAIVKAMPGLVTSKKIVAGSLSNFYVGTDLEGEEETIDTWYEKKDDKQLSRIDYKIGTQIAFPSEVVVYTAS